MADSYRQERIERLLGELRYEIERGMLEREIEEELHFRFIVPHSKHFRDGVVMCQFRTRPLLRFEAFGLADPCEAKLKVIKGGKSDG